MGLEEEGQEVKQSRRDSIWFVILMALLCQVSPLVKLRVLSHLIPSMYETSPFILYRSYGHNTDKVR